MRLMVRGLFYFNAMKTTQQYIDSLEIDRSNLHHIAETGQINGSLYQSLQRMIKEVQADAMKLITTADKLPPLDAKKKRAKKPKVEKAPDSCHQAAVDYWIKEHPEWTFSAAHGRGVKNALAWIRGRFLKKNGEECPDDLCLDTFKHILKRLPPFWKNQPIQTIAARLDTIWEDITKGGVTDQFVKANSTQRFGKYSQS